MDIAKSVEIGRQSLSGQEIEFAAAWTDFKTEFGTKVLPFFSGLLRFGSDVLRDSPSEKEAPRFGDLSVPQQIHEALANSFKLIPGFGPDQTKSPSINAISNSVGRPIQITTVTKLDSKVLATSVSSHLGGALGSGTYGGGIDPGLGLPMAGVKY